MYKSSSVRLLAVNLILRGLTWGWGIDDWIYLESGMLSIVNWLVNILIIISLPSVSPSVCVAKYLPNLSAFDKKANRLTLGLYPHTWCSRMTTCLCSRKRPGHPPVNPMIRSEKQVGKSGFTSLCARLIASPQSCIP